MFARLRIAWREETSAGRMHLTDMGAAELETVRVDRRM